MKKPTVKYSKGEIGRIRIVEDFLPSPDRLLVLTDEQVAEVCAVAGTVLIAS